MTNGTQKMQITLRHVPIGELAAGYEDNGEEGVVGYGGRLDIRPKYQREFVYKDAQRDAVIRTALENRPLNIMYWAVENDHYELIDGQQRTISICEFIRGNFSVGFDEGVFFFHSLPPEMQEAFLKHEILVYLCEGDEGEKLRWFQTVNIAGEKLNLQEIRNAVYCGSFVSDAKRWFSRPNCPARGLANDYLKGAVIRQDFLETALKWVSDDDVEKYMSEHRHDEDANALWQYFQQVIEWVKATFGENTRKEMQSVNWGELYNEFHTKKLDAAAIQARVDALMADDEEITRPAGIYRYVLDGQEKWLSLRTFPPSIKRKAYERAGGKCQSAWCGHKEITFEEAHADHEPPWSKGGKTILENCQILCRDCNLKKGAR